MKKMISIWMIAIVLTGCGVDDYQPLVTWSGNITEQNERFILSYDDDRYPASRLDDHEQWWLSVQECAGISIDISGQPMIVEYTPADQLPNGFADWIEWYDQYTRVSEQWIDDGKWTRHAMVHYLLFLIGTADNENSDHESIWFDSCVF